MTDIVEVTQQNPPPNCPAWTFVWIVDELPDLSGPTHPTTGRPLVGDLKTRAKFSGIRQLPPGGVLTTAKVIGVTSGGNWTPVPVDPAQSCVDQWNTPQPGYTETVTLLWVLESGQNPAALTKVTVEVEAQLGANTMTFSFDLQPT